jgi:hypothetical protein
MDIISKLLGLSELRQLHENNLYLQGIVDAHLEQIYTTCPSTVAKFLLSMRSLSRIHHETFISTSLTNTKENMIEDLKFSIKIYKNIDNEFAHLDDHNKCQILKNIKL